jgi:hypothetical protein
LATAPRRRELGASDLLLSLGTANPREIIEIIDIDKHINVESQQS